MSSKRQDEAPADGAAELEAYAPAETELIVGGESFTIRPMTLRQSVRFRRLSPRGLGGANTEADDPQAEEDYLALLALVLSTPERPIDVAWVEAHCSAADGMRVMAAWAAHNQDYLGEAGRFTQGMVKLAGRVSPNGTVSLAPSPS